MSNATAAAKAAAASESAHLKAIKHRGEFEYPIQIWYFTLSALCLATVINVASIAWSWYRVHLRSARQSGDAPGLAQRRFSIFRVPAAVLTASRIIAFRWQVPLGTSYTMSLFELFVTAIYMSALLIWEFVHTNNLDPAFWSNKAAHMAAVQLPLLPALSAKNNVIGFLTGVGHEKVFTPLTLEMYRVGFTGVDDIAANGWQQLGVAAGTTYTLMIILSIRPIRQASYETFYFVHVTLAFVFVLMAYLHASEPGFGYYIYPVWVVWGFERLFRLGRYIVINFILRPKHSEASLSLVTSDSLRLTLYRRFPIGWRPGQHVFLAFPTLSNVPVESHPFTIANIPDENLGEEQRLTFIIKGREGLTQKLLQQATEKDGIRIPVFVDGPYGAPPNLAPYATCILIAGGTGVSYTLPLLLDLVRQVRDGKALAKKIVFIWAVRNEEYIDWISSLLAAALSSAPSSLAIDINLYVTDTRAAVASHQAQASDTPSSPGEKSEKSQESVEVGNFLPLRGRPNVAELLAGELSIAEGPVSVNVSGPATLAKAVRLSLADVATATIDVLRGGPTVYFHAEHFTL
ncbi:hypothetical protein EVG20_g10 [Dentipellis fragilis]|uniref:ferric-chelate reductase (NADPH) n=1 Tax=Dentipellis fragilis TaxID=205917 RepID=A0A4Y9ZEU0_9AGAM|nr:hypothetical protein EVG20_g10 [Dentipellis fragilis]